MILILLIRGTFGVLFKIGERDADWCIFLSRRQKNTVTAVCAVQAADIARYREAWPGRACLLGILAGCLLAACTMDLWEQAVYRFVWQVGSGVAGIILLSVVQRELRDGEVGKIALIAGLLLFILIQYMLFGRMYGKADCHAFCTCAIVFAAMGGGFRDYVLHMAMAFLGLALVQWLRGNIASDGNLREPVPFLPYITVSFWLWVDFMSGKWYIR